MEITRKQYAEIVRRVAFNFSREIDVRRDYSGRAMFGRDCIGVTGRLGDVYIFVMELANVVVEAQVEAGEIDEGDTDEQQDRKNEIIVEIMDNTHSDNMGSDMIYYWPNVQAV